ncbi:leucine-rich repeat-containing protein 61 isoform X1 [Sciurus carolinensis]|uniref:leucine-rich repeat-containing protein 61 isoform X1 n=1 Tax=Sciurus carolinensis TaxID=30640 RepID=UPI001FB39F41|nr:leucine-rich repeat-containing protein 61 isoform X1 [Sciurus carolinensis]XP_047416855.1 leucine-rich repeat-containing protein 61 isoform X1 [Sciurus carolinensis]XP_047416856.1 leucine-rich repeat-containing protein 61 isoform X1 [Sciurus carolinensis]
MERLKRPPKRQIPSGLVGQEPPVSASCPETRPKSPAATSADPSPDFNTRATNTPRGLGLPEMEVKLEFMDMEENAGSGQRKIRSLSSQKKCERDSSLQRSSSCPLPSGTVIPSSDLGQAFVEKQVEAAFGPSACCGKRKTRSLGRPSGHPASQAKCRSGPGQNKPKKDSGIQGLRLVLGQEPHTQPEKRKVSKQKARTCGGEGKQTGRKAKSSALRARPAPSTPALVRPQPPSLQMTSPDRLEVSQFRENKEAVEADTLGQKAVQADVLTTHLATEVQHPKKWKKKHLLPGVREKLGPQLSLQETPCLKKLVRAMKTEMQSLNPAPRATGLKPGSDIRQFFTMDFKNTCQVICTLCHASVRQGKTEGRSRASGLIRHLASEHGLEWDRRLATSSAGKGIEGMEQAQLKALPTGAASFASRGQLVSLGGSDREPDPGRPDQPLLASPPLPASPAAVSDSLGGTDAPEQRRTQAWNHSIAELLCSLALPFSFVSSQPFKRFMAQVDPQYHLPPPAFFSDKALPLLHEAVGEQVLQEMQWAKGGHIHLTASVLTQDSMANYVAVTAHWVGAQSGSKPGASGNLRKRALLWVRGLSLETDSEDRQPELLEQISLWLGRGSLRAGFLVSGGCPSLELAMKAEGYTHIPCFAHCLDSLVSNFLCHHHSVQIILGTARAICSHFQGSAEARNLLSQLQHQCGLPAQQPFEALSDHWGSAYRLMEWLVEQQQALQEYAEKQQPGKASTALSAMFWSLADSLVKLLQPFQMVIREASTAQASLSQVLPQLRYLHIFLEQVHRHFQEQSAGEVGAALRLAEGLALQLSTDCQLNDLFHREELVLATLLDPRFKGKVEAILPAGADIDHWKQVLVYKVKEIMVSQYSVPTPGSLRRPRSVRVSTNKIAKGPRAQGRGQKESLQKDGNSSSFLLVQREKTLLERLESVGLIASESSGASLSTENHLASIIVKRYLRENETIGAQEDPLSYWEKKHETWPALAQLATVYLSCPPTGAFSEGVFAALNSPIITEQASQLKVETVEHLLFLNTNLERFPHYAPPPLICSSADPAEQQQTL